MATSLFDGHPGLDQPLRRMFAARQRFDSSAVGDVAAALTESLQRVAQLVHPGARIALGVGSRGMAELPLLVKTTVDFLYACGAEPFIVPAMGSHGGATGEGQAELLADFGVTATTMGCPVRSAMDVVEVGLTASGTTVYCDAYAAGADAIVVINRVKPHTNFKAAHESGLVKMLAVGISKQAGASAYHHLGFAAFDELLPEVAKVMIEKLPVLFGVATVENATNQVRRVEAVPSWQMIRRDAELLIESKKAMGSILVPNLDLLILDEMGKNISGLGMDPNITGRSSMGLPGFPHDVTERIAVLGLTAQSRGNAHGVGVADVITSRLLGEIDFETLWTNGLSSRAVAGSRIPLVARTDRAAIEIGLHSCTGVSPAGHRVARLRSTAQLNLIELSENLIEEAQRTEGIEILDEPREWFFDDDGGLGVLGGPS